MRHAIYVIVAGLTFIVMMVTHAQDAELAALSWVAGCWAAGRGDRGSGEQWMPLAGGTMLGVGRTVRDGAAVEYEFLQIRKNAEGKLVYIALPSGQAETTFTMTSAAAD